LGILLKCFAGTAAYSCQPVSPNTMSPGANPGAFDEMTSAIPPPAITVLGSTAARGCAVHPGPVGGIERNITHPQQGFAVPGVWNASLGHLEMLRSQFPGRLVHQQNLAIDTIAHGIPSH
jgi:hypothetical protein